MSRLILASGSKMRHRLLADAGLSFSVQTAGIDESAQANEGIWEKGRRLARDKALAVAAQTPEAWVVGADQVGVVEGRTIQELQKCDNIEMARRQLFKMQGETHRFLSTAAIARGEEVLVNVEEFASVTFRSLNPGEIDRYLLTHEWKGSCGSYQIENRGAQLVQEVEGSLMAIFGLPLFPLLNALRDLVGLTLWHRIAAG